MGLIDIEIFCEVNFCDLYPRSQKILSQNVFVAKHNVIKIVFDYIVWYLSKLFLMILSYIITMKFES